MGDWIPDLSTASGPKYLAIAEALSRDVDAGRLAPGDRLPPQRSLAEALGVDLTTVTRAYGEAQRLGLVEGSGRRGSFVRARGAPAPRQTPMQTPRPMGADPGDQGMNAPPEGFGGTLAAAFRDCAAGLLAGESALLPFQYQRSGGASGVRRAGMRLLGSRNVPCTEDSVLVAAGGQHALHAIFSAEFAAGDAVAVCAFAYPGLIALAHRFGVRLVPIASDEAGMDPQALEAACAAERVRGLYIVPANDNPTTITMPAQRREAIAAIVERHGLLLIEDDAYGLLPERPLAPIAALAPGRTWHVASMSKILAPGLRVAWLRAPDVAKAWRLAADMHETAIMAPPLNAAVVAEWIETGVFPRLVGEVRQEARSRQDIARRCLPAEAFRSQAEGYHLWVRAGADADTRHIADVLRQHGIAAVPGTAFAVDRAGNAGSAMLRVSIGGATSQETLHHALPLLAALISPGAPRKISLV